MTKITIINSLGREMEIDVSIDDSINWFSYVDGMEDLFLLEQLPIKNLIQKLYNVIYDISDKIWNEIDKISIYCEYDSVEKMINVTLTLDFVGFWWVDFFDEVVIDMECARWVRVDNDSFEIDFRGFKYPVGRLANYIVERY